MKKWTKRLKRFIKIPLWLSLFFLIAFLIYFPGSQTPIAFTLATGIGVDGLQSRVDQMEDKAIGREEFTQEDKRFLENLYTCFAKGGRLTYVLRQTSQMMRGTFLALAKTCRHRRVFSSTAVRCRIGWRHSRTRSRRTFGRKYALRIDDGLGGHLAELGLAKPFLVWSEWEDE